MNVTGQQRQLFDQGALLDVLVKSYGGLAEEAETVASIQDGICYMLSMEWLLRLLDNPNAYPDSIFNAQFQSPSALMYYKQIANAYYQYSSDFDYTFSHRAGHPGAQSLPGTGIADFDNHYVTNLTKGRHSVPNAINQYTAPADITNAYPADCALLLSLDVSPNAPNEDDFAHEMAIWRRQGANYFFDPNYGVFQLADLSAIIADIFNEYVASIPGGAAALLTITSII